jgi:hypothetical protein
MFIIIFPKKERNVDTYSQGKRVSFHEARVCYLWVLRLPPPLNLSLALAQCSPPLSSSSSLISLMLQMEVEADL